MHAPLTHWLRLLWDRAPQLAFDGECPYIAAGAIHLPVRPHWQHHTAAAAHAAAHLVYSPRRFDGAGLGPIARMLMALLEDARVEALAVRELPGLARLWRPLHTVTPDAGGSFAGLAARLARGLSDPAYDDPDPWVRKARHLCFLDAALSVPALRTAAELRQAATRLGHDIGQMRLGVDGRTALPLPAYRDDHRWMWAADVLQAVPPLASPAPPDPDPPDESAPEVPTATRHAEWDRLIARLRPSWCSVVEAAAPEAPTRPLDDPTRAVARQLLGPLGNLTRRSVRPGVGDSGDAFDLDALVHWQLGRRLRRPGPARVYRRSRRQPGPAAVWLLLDASASTAATVGSAGGGALRAASQAALAIGLALQGRGLAVGIAAFRSSGRHAVDWKTVKSFAEPVDDALVGRVQALRAKGSTRFGAEALRAKGSTRLGAVLHHATLRLAAQRGAARWVLLLSDGHPHDVDVHDPGYLPEDARRAVADARRRGVRIACLLFGADEGRGVASRIVGMRGVVRVGDRQGLVGAVRRLEDR